MSDDEDYKAAALKALYAHQQSQFADELPSNQSDDNDDDDGHSDAESFDSDDDILAASTSATPAHTTTADEVEDLFSVGRSHASATKGKGKQSVDGLSDAQSKQKQKQKQPQVVVFGEQPGSVTASTRDRDGKRAQKAFMSSKVNKVQNGPSTGTASKQRGKSGGGPEMSEVDRTNLQHDKELEQLLHSQLFTSREHTSKMSAGDRMRMYEGRLLEIAGKAAIGSGASQLKKSEHKKASGAVRTGLEKHDKDMKKIELQRAKDMGIYDKSLKHLYEGAQGKSKATKRAFGSVNADRDNKRSKGLGMGVGSFRNGMLNISKSEIDSVNAQPRRRGK